MIRFSHSLRLVRPCVTPICTFRSGLARGQYATGRALGHKKIPLEMHLQACPALQKWSGLMKDSVRCVIRILVLSTATAQLVAIWAALQATISHACAATLWPTLHLASVTALQPSVMEEFNRWTIYKMQKVLASGQLHQLACPEMNVTN